ncbi:MAG: hypothetical protein H6742_12870 [Alphaproteobacteria bacterium]|nr:hypothetical protein [Alphaproteobacteria bacterium]
MRPYSPVPRLPVYRHVERLHYIVAGCGDLDLDVIHKRLRVKLRRRLRRKGSKLRLHFDGTPPQGAVRLALTLAKTERPRPPVDLKAAGLPDTTWLRFHGGGSRQLRLSIHTKAGPLDPTGGLRDGVAWLLGEPCLRLERTRVASSEVYAVFTEASVTAARAAGCPWTRCSRRRSIFGTVLASWKGWATGAHVPLDFSVRCYRVRAGGYKLEVRVGPRGRDAKKLDATGKAPLVGAADLHRAALRVLRAAIRDGHLVEVDKPAHWKGIPLGPHRRRGCLRVRLLHELALRDDGAPLPLLHARADLRVALDVSEPSMTRLLQECAQLDLVEVLNAPGAASRGHYVRLADPAGARAWPSILGPFYGSSSHRHRQGEAVAAEQVQAAAHACPREGDPGQGTPESGAPAWGLIRAAVSEPWGTWGPSRADLRPVERPDEAAIARGAFELRECGRTVLCPGVDAGPHPPWSEVARVLNDHLIPTRRGQAWNERSAKRCANTSGTTP